MSIKNRRNALFQHGSAAYLCNLCQRTTRETGSGEASTGLCRQCFDLASIDNAVNDGAPLANYAEERDQLIAIVAARGGDVARVRAACTFLFPHKD